MSNRSGTEPVVRCDPSVRDLIFGERLVGRELVVGTLDVEISGGPHIRDAVAVEARGCRGIAAGVIGPLLVEVAVVRVAGTLAVSVEAMAVRIAGAPAARAEAMAVRITGAPVASVVTIALPSLGTRRIELLRSGSIERRLDLSLIHI